MKAKNLILTVAGIIAVCLVALTYCACNKINPIEKTLIDGTFKYDKKEKKGDYWEYTCLTSNIHEGRNRVKAIVLHHTATPSTLTSLKLMAGQKPEGKVSCHVIISTDGTRYILAPPEAITWHAGRSTLNGKNDCNRFTVGIEFQGNTIEHPLTEEQIQSAIDYCLPIMKKYGLNVSDIVTHRQIRDEYIRSHLHKKVPAKPDITDKEYKRFKKALKKRMKEKPS